MNLQIRGSTIFRHLTRGLTMSPKKNCKNHIVWMDLEMTGLNHRTDQILEIGCLITNENLDVVAETPEIVIHQPLEVLNSMNDWCKKQHAETGLIKASLNSTISTEQAEKQILEFLETHIPKGVCPLAGNSVYMDRLFLREYMPNVDEYLHYRIIDVSSLKELCKRWSPNIFNNAPQKALKHRGLDDIKESLDELKYYKKFMFT